MEQSANPFEDPLDNFKSKCPQQYTQLFDALEAVMELHGYPAYKHGYSSGSTRSSNGNFMMYRQHGTEKKFMFYSYNAQTNTLTQKVLKTKAGLDHHYDKVREDLNLR